MRLALDITTIKISLSTLIDGVACLLVLLISGQAKYQVSSVLI